MVIYSHDTYGLGHLRRCLKISEALNHTYPELTILLLTGSSYAGRYPLPEGMDFIKLPAVVKVSDNTYRPRSLGISFTEILELRQNLIFEAVRTFNPALLLVDHSPLGMKGELKKTLFWLKEENPRCQLVLGLRDIIDEPAKVIADWEAEGVHKFLDLTYDRIFVYGTPEVFDLVGSYSFGQLARAKTSYTGFITNPTGGPTNIETRIDRRHLTKEVFLTLGGGEDGGEIVATYLSMLSQYRSRVDIRTTIVTGPLFPDPARSILEAEARALGVEFTDFIPDLAGHLKRADLVVSMGGYNTVAEILATARKALIIPRTYPRKEQLIRAQRLSDMGLVSFIPPDQLTPAVLFDTISSLLSREDDPLAEARETRLLPLDGAAKVASLCYPMLKTPLEVH
jgi:predicted glycosyltransferase